MSDNQRQKPKLTYTNNWFGKRAYPPNIPINGFCLSAY